MGNQGMEGGTGNEPILGNFFGERFRVISHQFLEKKNKKLFFHFCRKNSSVQKNTFQNKESLNIGNFFLPQ